MTEPINQRDTQGRRHGVWEDYWEDGTLNRRRHYLHGKLYGFFEYYLENGTLWWRENYLHGETQGLLELYTPNGTLERKKYRISIK
jgi:antitoxin component YwqK of YwqJK toxin-antitoxin module